MRRGQVMEVDGEKAVVQGNWLYKFNVLNKLIFFWFQVFERTSEIDTVRFTEVSTMKVSSFKSFWEPVVAYNDLS